MSKRLEKHKPDGHRAVRPDLTACNTHKRVKNGAGLPDRLVSAIFILVLMIIGFVSAPVFAIHLPSVIIVDSQGPDQLDQANDPGNSQQDLAGAIIAPHGEFGWAWDEIDLSGNNSIDTCTYFEESDGSVTSVCYTARFNSDGTVQNGFPIIATYDCGTTYDSSQQKCTGNNSISTEYSATCTDPAQVTSYFQPDDQLDLEASCQLIRDDINADPIDDLLLLNTCSKTSDSPSSNSNDCIFEELPAFLQLVKAFDPAGDGNIEDWTVSASSGGTVVLSAAGITPVSPVEQGTYDLSESGPASYDLLSLVCETDGSANNSIIPQVELTGGTLTVCTFTNKLATANLTLVKRVINDNGGGASPTEWELTADGTDNNDLSENPSGPVACSGISNCEEASTSTVELLADTFTLSEFSISVAEGYSASNWNCDGGMLSGSDLTLDPGDNVTCTITNDDDAASLTLVKHVENDNGGQAQASAWTLHAGTNSVAGSESGALATDQAGTYALSESGGVAGYSASAWNCVGGSLSGDDVTIGLGEDATCTITNDDISPTITVNKIIVNDDGGLVTDENAFGLQVDGGSVDHGVTNTYDAGSHTVSELGLAGYAAGTWGGDCAADGSIDLALDQDAVCTITNDDISPTLKVVKTIINDNGGLITDPDAFMLTIDTELVLSGAVNNVSAGDHTVSETNLAGYAAGTWGGDCAADGSITLALDQDATCTITNDDISPTLTVIKTVINDNGGLADPDDFNLTVDGGAVLSGATNDFPAGDHNAAETNLPGYSAGTWGGDCAADGSITLALDQDATCTITNDDISPTITVNKIIVNDDGGLVTDENAFGLQVDGGSVDHGVTNTYDAGSHTVSELGLAGYAAGTWGGDCAADGSIDLALDQDAVCTITNDDISPTLKVVKTIINDNGGLITDPDAFMLTIDTELVSSGAVNNVSAGDHTVSETNLAGYAAGTWGGDCAADGSITLALDQDATCTITNDDISPTLTVIKTVINDNGGLADPDDFNLTVDGGAVLSGATNDFPAGDHNAAETNLPGYSAGTWGGDCAADGSITLALDQDATCTITNDDISPTLTVIKTVINDNGGLADPDDFNLTVDGGAVLSGATNDFPAGDHNAAETNLPGYSAGTWGGDCAADGSITLALDQDATCTITNDDISPTITVNKIIVNDDGGLVTDENAFGLQVDGGSVDHGVTNTYDAGSHTVSELGLAGYAAGTWGGDCAADGSIDLALDQDAVCTITNDDISPTLKVVKTIINDNGGLITDPDAFMLTIDTELVSSGAVNNVSAGDHTVSETNLAGYAAGTWGGDCAADGSITLALDQDATCTITNDDISPTLTVIKTVINDNGGLADPDDFNLTVDGGAVLSGATNDFPAGDHNAAETNLPGYSAGTWGGDCAADGSITLALDQDATCTITNDDISPTITVNKIIVNDDGGLVTDENAFGLQVDGGSVDHGVTNTYDAGSHTVSELGLAGYAAGTWGGDCAADGSIDLALDQDAVCTITNDDISPTLKVVKTIINDNGGLITDPDAFMLTIDTELVLSGAVNNVSAGDHTVSETNLAGYAAGTWGGDCAADGSITLALDQDATCTITNDDISPTLTVIKTVINDNGGLADPDDFNLTVDGGAVLSGATNDFPAGDHNAAETNLPGYSAGTWGGDCAADGSITLALDQDATCTITNDDISPTLTVIKTVINDNGGLADPDDFNLTVDGGAVLSGATNDFAAGDHNAAETNLPGYSAGTWGGDCAADGSITLALDQDATCTITNDDISPTLTVIKTVINDNGGLADPDDFNLTVDGGAVLSGATNDFPAGDHNAAETNLPGYSAGTWGGDCAADGSITLALDQDATCTITNDDISPTLTVIKTVINDNGGLADPDDFNLTVDGGAVLSGATNDFAAGDHNAAETNLPGYSAGAWGGDCAADGSITLALDQDATCTITNDDISPTLTVIKTVINDNGGLADPDDFNLTVDGGAVLSGATNDFAAGDHNAAETNLPGYSAGTWGGDCAADGSITLALDQDATCTITNDDISPTLTVIKTVINDNGGLADPDDFNLTVDGGAVLSGATNDFAAGDHNAAETNLPGYSAGAWGGDCAADGSITLALDQDATCTITNDDISPTLTVIKTVINDNGGLADPDDFNLTVDGGAVLSGATNDFAAGDHNAAETNLPGYSAGAWGGDCAADGSITLALDQDATCTITNDDISPTLTVIKTVINDNGGLADPDDFNLTVDGGAVLSGATNTVDAGAHTAAETNLPGYSAGTWGGDCAADGSITLALDQDATCTITNDDISPTLTVIKTVINDNGGLADPDDFNLTVDGGAVLSGATNTVDAGAHTAAETNLPGYSAGTWGGDCAADGSITLALDQDATCTITNDDISPTLTVIKTVINDNGGLADPDDFNLTVDGGAVLSGATNTVDAGAHTAAETNLPGYSAGTWGGDCAADGSVILALAQNAVCTITNDDIPPSLTLIKVVDNLGESGPAYAVESDFTLTADGPTPISGAGGASSGNDFSAGSYDLSESSVPDYSASAWSCTGNGSQSGSSIDLDPGESAICTITNTLIPMPALAVVKDADPTAISAPTTINYTVTITNTGNVTLLPTLTDLLNSGLNVDLVVNLTLTDDGDGVGNLSPGETWVYMTSYDVTQQDIDDGNDIVNVVCADDVDGDGNDECDDGTTKITRTPGHTLVKDFDPDEVQVDGQGTFTLVYTNTGNVTLTDVEITDNIRPILEVNDVSIDVADGFCGDTDNDPQTLECSVTDVAPNEVVTVTVIFTAVAEADVLVDGSGQTSGATYVFYFENGSTLYGSTDTGEAYLRDPNGIVTDASSYVSGKNQDIVFDPPGSDPAFELHLSCSEPFIDGWGQTGPIEGVDVNWRIDAYDVNRYNSGGFLKSCGQTFTPFDVNNTAAALATPPAGTTLVPNPLSASDTLTIIDEATIVVSRTRKAKGGIRLQLHNFGVEDVVITDLDFSCEPGCTWSGVGLPYTLPAGTKVWVTVTGATAFTMEVMLASGSTYTYVR